MGMRIFTPSSARRSLDSIRPAAADMCRLYRVMEHQRPSEQSSDRLVDPGYFAMVQELNTALDKLKAVGVQVKDPRVGLIDFPARREGRLVFLCWKVGESRLDFWHELEDGFGGRRPVDDEGPWEGVQPEVEKS